MHDVTVESPFMSAYVPGCVGMDIAVPVGHINPGGHNPEALRDTEASSLQKTAAQCCA